MSIIFILFSKGLNFSSVQKKMGEPVHYILLSFKFLDQICFKSFVYNSVYVQLDHSSDDRHIFSQYWRQAKTTQATTLVGKYLGGDNFYCRRRHRLSQVLVSFSTISRNVQGSTTTRPVQISQFRNSLSFNLSTPVTCSQLC